MNQNKTLKVISDKVGRILFFGILFAFLLMVGSTHPFQDNDMMSNAMLIGAAISILIPTLAVIFTGHLWCNDLKRQFIVQVASSIFFMGSGWYMVFDVLRWKEWIGSTPVIQFGLYLTYSYYPVIIYMTSVVLMVLVTNAGMVPGARSTGGKGFTSNSLVVSLLLAFGCSWLLANVYLDGGITWALIFQFVAGSIYVVLKSIEILRIDWKSIESRGREMNGATTTFEEKTTKQRKGRQVSHGFFVLLKVVFASIVILGSIFVNFSILQSFIGKPNYIPLWLQFIPILLASSLCWAIFYKFLRSRLGVALLSITALFIMSLVLQSRPDSYLVYQDLILWLCAFSISGTFYCAFLFSHGMVKGKYSRVLWTTFLIAFTIITLFVGILVKADMYSDDNWIYGISIAMICYIIIGTGFLFSRKVNLFASIRKKREIPTPENLKGKIKLEYPVKHPRDLLRTKKELIIGMALICMVALVPAVSIPVVEANNTEQVLGTYNGDYYLWYADNLRTVDSKYTPNLPGSPVDSTVRVTLARGEHEGFQVVFTPWNVKNLNAWYFKPLGDLNNAVANRTIGSGNISVFQVDYVDQLHDQYPDRLLPFTRLDTSYSLNGQKNWPFYVDVFVPADDVIPSGIYTTTMELYCRDFHEPLPGEESAYKERIVTFQLEVEVLNFTIPVERHLDTEIIWGIPNDQEWRDFFGAYRMDWYFGPRPVQSYNETPGNLALTFDWPTYFTALDAAIQNGMSYFPISYKFPGLDWSILVMNESCETLFTWYIGNMTEQLLNRTTPWGTPYIDHAYYFIRDEPPPEFDVPITYIANLIYNVSTNVSGNSSRIRVMETLNRNLEEYAPGFLESVDIYCTHIHDWFPEKSYPEDEEIEGWPAILGDVRDANPGRSRELWVYHTHNHFPTPDTDIYMSGIMQRNAFWLHWIYNITGYLYWSFNWGTDMSGGYGYAGFGESTLIGYGEGDAPLSSLRLERVRDGIEDFEYFWLLENACTVLEGNANASIQQEATPGRQLLEAVDQMFNQPHHLQRLPGATGDNFEGYRWSYNPEAKPYIDLRNQVGGELSRLYSLGIV